MSKIKKVLIISGTRSEYGLLKPVIESLEKNANLEIQLVVTGSHLEKIFGKTIKEIKKDFKINEMLKLPLEKDTNEAMSVLIGNSIVGFTRIFNKLKPSLILILGDRIEIFGAAITAYYMNIPIAHLHGGDKSLGGHLDDSVRHAITKLSHIHLVATKQSAKRIIKTGEEPWRVYKVGAPGIDSILRKKLIPPAKIASKYKLDLSKPIILALQHSVTTEVEDASKQMRETMEAIKELGFQTVLIYPNADAGGRKMIKVIERYKKYPFIKIYKSLPHIDYLGLMSVANVMAGNSSSGIIETPLFHLPVVNIGQRQQGRERSENIIDVNYNKEQIKRAIKKAIYDKNFKRKVKKSKNPYGDGKAGIRIARILSKIKIDKKLLQKKITY